MKSIFLLTLAVCSLAAVPATKPVTPPARVRDGLVNGSIRFLVPAEWELADRGANGTSVGYRLPEEKGGVVMLVTQQKEGIPVNDARVRAQLIKFVLDNAAADLKARNKEVIDAPKVESDARFMAKIHERFKDGDTTIDAVHLYRAVGLNLVSVTASASTDDKAEAKVIHDAGALMLMSVTVGPPDPKMIRPLKKE